MAPPFRAEQIGSLLRPSSVISARSGLNAASYPSANAITQDVTAATKTAVKSALASQLQHSVRPLTNGEFSRHIFYGGFFETLQGMEVRSLALPEGFRTDFLTVLTLQRLGVKVREGIVAVGKIKWASSAYIGEWEEMKETLTEVCVERSGSVDEGQKLSKKLWKECKITIPSISWQHMQLKHGTAWSATSGYDTDKEYFEDLAKAYQREIRALYDAGLRSVQIDDPNLTYFASETFLAGCKKDGIDADELLDLYIWAHNLCLVDKPADLHVGIHLCRGNMPGATHTASGSYERIATKLFQEMDYNSFYLEFDTDRAGGFEPLRFLPRGKNVILGVVTTKFGELEDMHVLETRVKEAAAVIAKAQGRSTEEVLGDQIGVSPQCGFASMSSGGGKGVTEERMWEKLDLVRDLASRIWPNEVVARIQKPQ